MRKLQYSTPYMRYMSRMYERQYHNKVKPLHEEIRWSHTYTTPGCHAHVHPRRNVVFHNKTAPGLRGNVNQLYWRMHKAEYESLGYKLK